MTGGTRFRLVAFDMDGTLIPDTTADLWFATLLGRGGEVAKLEQLYESGSIDEAIFASEVSHCLDGLTLELIDSSFERMPKLAGIAETVSALRELGTESILITSSGHHYAEAFRARFGFAQAYGTIHEVSPDGRIGRATTICSAKSKAGILLEHAARRAISRWRCAAVGDSRSDVEMFTVSGYRVALNYKPALWGRADVYVRTSTLLDVLPLLSRCKRSPSAPL